MANPLQEFPIADGATRVQKKNFPEPVSSHGLIQPGPGKPKTPRISGRPRDISLESAYRAVNVAHMLPDSQWILVNGKEPHLFSSSVSPSERGSASGNTPICRRCIAGTIRPSSQYRRNNNRYGVPDFLIPNRSAWVI